MSTAVTTHRARPEAALADVPSLLPVRAGVWLAIAGTATWACTYAIALAHTSSTDIRALSASLIALSCGALAAAALRLASIWLLTWVALHSGTSRGIGKAAITALRVIAPRAAHNAAIAGGIAGSALALTLGPAVSSPGPAAPTHVSSALAYHSGAHVESTTRTLTFSGPLETPHDTSQTPRDPQAESPAAELISTTFHFGKPTGDEPHGPHLASAATALSHTASSVSPPPKGEQQDNTPRTTWIVKPGDTLWSIATDILHSSGTSHPTNADIIRTIDRLCEANSIHDPNVIVASQVITISPSITR